MPLHIWLPNVIAIAIIFTFFSMERRLRIGKEAKSLDPSKSDGNSTTFVAIALMTALFSIFAALALNYFNICTIQANFIGYAALLFMAVGLYIRVYSARTLGRFYTRTLKTIDQQEIVDTGIYKYIRHPGYLGVILLFVSGSLATQNYISLGISIAIILPAYLYRISAEEAMLSAQFGEKYEVYKLKSYRLLPGIY